MRHFAEVSPSPSPRKFEQSSAADECFNVTLDNGTGTGVGAGGRAAHGGVLQLEPGLTALQLLQLLVAALGTKI